MNEAIKFQKGFMAITFDTLKTLSDTIGNYQVHLALGGTVVELLDVHVGLGSKNHYDTIVGICKDKYPKLTVSRVDVDTRKMKGR